MILWLWVLEPTPWSSEKPVQPSCLSLVGTLEETVMKSRPFLNDDLSSTYKKHQLWGHQKKFQRKHMDIRKLCCLLIMNKSSASVSWEMGLAQDFIFKENWWSIKAKSICDQPDNPISLSLHELWQTPNVTPKKHQSNCLWILPTEENAASEKEHSWLSSWSLNLLFLNEQK